MFIYDCLIFLFIMFVEMVFLVVAILLFFGFFGEWVFEKTKIPDVIWLILIGIILSSVLNWTSSASLASAAPFFTTFALIYLLFEAGINTDIKSFLKSAPRGLALSILSFVFSFGIVFGLSLLLGESVGLSLLLGVILSGVSSAVVIPVINGIKDLDKTTKLSLMFDSAFSDVLCILGTVTIIQILTLETSVDGFLIFKDVLSSFVIAIGLGILAAFLWNNLLSPKINNHHLVLTIAFMLIIYSVTQLLGANGAIASLVFGLILANTTKIKDAFNPSCDVKSSKTNSKKSISKSSKKSLIESNPEVSALKLITKHSKDVYGELAFAIKTFFFVYLGILVNFSNPLSFVWALIFVVGLFLARPFAVFLSFGKSTKLSDAKLLSTLIPKGLAAAVLVQLPIQAGIPGAESLVNIVLAVILISILLSSLFTLLSTNDRFKGVIPILFRKYQR